jgi:MFS family permease
MNIFASLQFRNFRYFAVGQSVGLVGMWMQRTALVWLVYVLTDSPLMVGLISICQFLPMLLFTMLAGVIVDRIPSKKRLLLFTNVCFMLQGLVITILAFTKVITVTHIFLLSAFFGTLQTLEMPARQSFFPELIDRQHIMNAVSLNSSIFNLAKIIGPAFSGIVMAAWGTEYCFLVNTVSYIVVLIAFYLIDAPPKAVAPHKKNVVQDMLDGFRYINANNVLRVNVIIMTIVCIFSFNNDVCTPIYAREALHMGSDAYTTLMSTTGLGSLLGAFYMSGRAMNGINTRILVTGIFMLTGAQIFLFFNTTYILAMAATALVGFSIIVYLNMANSIFQLHTEDQYLGRVMSVYSFLDAGLAPVGSLYAGTLMEMAGGVYGFLGCGLGTLIALGLAYILFKQSFRQWSPELDKEE